MFRMGILWVLDDSCFRAILAQGICYRAFVYMITISEMHISQAPSVIETQKVCNYVRDLLRRCSPLFRGQDPDRRNITRAVSIRSVVARCSADNASLANAADLVYSFPFSTQPLSPPR